MKKIYVLDTNVLLHDPQAPLKFEDNVVVIPAVVLEEIDAKKRLQDEIGRNARQVSRMLDGLRERGRLHEGIPLDQGGVLKVELNHRSFIRLKARFGEMTSDNRMFAVALNYHLEEQESDTPQSGHRRQQGRACPGESGCARPAGAGLPVGPDRVARRVLYRVFAGVCHPAVIDAFYTDRSLAVSELGKTVYPNEFVILRDETGHVEIGARQGVDRRDAA